MKPRAVSVPRSTQAPHPSAPIQGCTRPRGSIQDVTAHLPWRVTQGCHCHSLEGLRARSSVPARVHARGFKPSQAQGETHWRDVSARFSLMATAMALPPSSYSRLAARLEGQRTQVTHEKLRTTPETPWGGLGALLGPMGLTPAS